MWLILKGGIILGLILMKFMPLFYHYNSIGFIDLFPFETKENKHLFLQGWFSKLGKLQNKSTFDLLIQLQIVKNTETYSMKVLSTAFCVEQAKLLINTH